MYRIGSLLQTNARFYSKNKIVWSEKPIKVLAVWITGNKDELQQINIEPIIEKAEAILSLWSARGLSLFGKIQIINALVASLFVHRLAVLPKLKDKYVKKINVIFQNFMWNKRKPKIALNILQGAKIDGGAGLVENIIINTLERRIKR